MSPKLPHSPPPISLIHRCHPPQTHANTVLPKLQATATAHLSILFAVIEGFFFFFFKCIFIWVWWLWWWWLILAMVMVVDDFDSGFVDFGCGGGG